MASILKQLAEFSNAVRISTIERLKLVPDGKENWRISPGAMSTADILYHLIETDEWLIRKIEMKNLKSILGDAGKVEIKTREEYLELIEELIISGKKRTELILSLDDVAIQQKIFDDRFGKEVSIWWIIVRGNLDHEIHHRGQLSIYLRAIKNQPSNTL